ncbi:hypothetical protein KMP13_04510 [Epibacterium ulvae]|uniref:hypothetical protein n=1 Tax=Epibacterium ulvae TaxID=1156985 RepID=UPI001BFC8294|nr:hypothetical protein [Epibacterium ulvae]MBT8153162.1 hypothetical protein [Epibacterium ulvae]
MTQFSDDMETYYRIDRNYQIVDVGGAWDDFAISNGSDECVSKYVIGDNLRNHITGDVIWMWFEALVTGVFVSGKTVERDYRCDAPYARRLFKLTCVLEAPETICFTHKLISEEAMDTTVAISTPTRLSNTTPRCSICNSVYLDGEWQDPFSLNRDLMLQATYTMCESCRDADADLSARSA